MVMPPPPPPPKRRHAPPPPPPKRRPYIPPPRARNLELERIRYEDSFIAPFVAGDFAAIPADVLPILREACASSAEDKTVSAGADLTNGDLIGAIFSFTDYPCCTIAEGARQLKDIIKHKTPFTKIDVRAIRWLAAELEANPSQGDRR